MYTPLAISKVIFSTPLPGPDSTTKQTTSPAFLTPDSLLNKILSRVIGQEKRAKCEIAFVTQRDTQLTGGIEVA
jgi:hypothetical protein